MKGVVVQMQEEDHSLLSWRAPVFQLSFKRKRKAVMVLENKRETIMEMIFWPFFKVTMISLLRCRMLMMEVMPPHRDGSVPYDLAFVHSE